MKTLAFIGPSGTGKSYRSISVAAKYGADAIIDDGLLISKNKLLAGISAKSEPTKIASVRRALFMQPSHAEAVSSAIRRHSISTVLILATSEKMADRIAEALFLPPPEKYISIVSEAAPEEIEAALSSRRLQGKHIIPVPTFEIKKDFSGYFLHPLKIFNAAKKVPEISDKSIVRPTFSYMGGYTISDNVITDMALFAANKHSTVARASASTESRPNGAAITLTLVLRYGCDIQGVCAEIIAQVSETVEKYTSVNVIEVKVFVKGLTLR